MQSFVKLYEGGESGENAFVHSRVLCKAIVLTRVRQSLGKFAHNQERRYGQYQVLGKLREAGFGTALSG